MKTRIAILIATAFLCACEQDLYSKQTEADVNEMVGALTEAGIAASKKTNDSGKTWIVAVDESEIGIAMQALKARGLPQQRYGNLGEIFKKDGLISTPTEERVRFIYGVTQELSQTLSQIDGVVVARVHVVLPNNDPLASVVKPASASVFVKHHAESNVTLLVPSVKNLVVSSVEGLKYENVNVTLVPTAAEKPSTGSALSAAAPRKSGQDWLLPAIAAAVVAALGLALFLFWWFRLRGGANESDESGATKNTITSGLANAAERLRAKPVQK
ncbi:MAG: type III secretion inner membrane ring lipoprotein SctJ [Pseudomonadota bacterium]